MQRVLFVTLSLSGGGAERVVAVLSSALSEMNQDIHVLVFKEKKSEYPLSKNVHKYQMPLSDYKSKVKRISYIRKIIREIKPDVIIPFLYEPMVYTYFASRNLGIKFIATVRNNPQFYPASGMQQKLATWIIIHADKCMLQTLEQASYFKWKNIDQYFVVPNPVDDRFIRARREYSDCLNNIVAIGRLTSQKNYPLLIKAFANISKKFPDVRLNIYGSGEEKENIERLIAELEQNGRIYLKGRTENVLEALTQAELYIMASDYEGMPNSLMEAMATGIPCISTACPTGPKSLISKNIDGFLVPVNDEEALTSMIKHCIENYEVCKFIGKEAKKKMRDSYSIDSCKKAFLKNLED